LKRLLVLVVALAAVLGTAAVSSASISITTDTSGQPQQILGSAGSLRWTDYYQSLSPFGSSCSGPNSISLSNSKPVLLRFAWVTSAQSQIGTFFQQNHGTYTLSGPAGTVTESWSETADGSPAAGTYVTWSNPFSGTFLLNGNPVPGWATGYFGLISGLTAGGPYTLSLSWTVDKRLYDGWGTQAKGTYSYSCTFSVTS